MLVNGWIMMGQKVTDDKKNMHGMNLIIIFISHLGQCTYLVVCNKL